MMAIIVFGALGSLSQCLADEASKPVKLRWKLVEGESVVYLHEQESVTQLKDGITTGKWSNRKSYLYRWTVFGETEDQSLVNATFHWVRKEMVTPDQKIAVDTLVPMAPTTLSPDLKELQDNAFRMLRSNFIFFATPGGDTALGDQIKIDGVTPPEVKVPDPIEFPQVFTPGDSLGFKSDAVKVGEEWKMRVEGAGIQGEATYRLIGRMDFAGHDCWVVHGSTIYDTASADPPGREIKSIALGPRQSRYYFDAEIGKLVHGEETLPFIMELYDGSSKKTVVTSTRELMDAPPEAQTTPITRQIAGGSTLPFYYRDGSPIAAKGNWADVRTAGITFAGKPGSSGDIIPSHVVWMVTLALKSQDLKSISLYDVTFDDAVLLDQVTPKSNDKSIGLSSEKLALDTPSADWFHQDEVTERIFRIVLENASGQKEILHQLTFIWTGSFREKIKNPELLFSE